MYYFITRMNGVYRPNVVHRQFVYFISKQIILAKGTCMLITKLHTIYSLVFKLIILLLALLYINHLIAKKESTDTDNVGVSYQTIFPFSEIERTIVVNIYRHTSCWCNAAQGRLYYNVALYKDIEPMPLLLKDTQYIDALLYLVLVLPMPLPFSRSRIPAYHKSHNQFSLLSSLSHFHDYDWKEEKNVFSEYLINMSSLKDTRIMTRLKFLSCNFFLKHTWSWSTCIDDQQSSLTSRTFIHMLLYYPDLAENAILWDGVNEFIYQVKNHDNSGRRYQQQIYYNKLVFENVFFLLELSFIPSSANKTDP